MTGVGSTAPNWSKRYIVDKDISMKFYRKYNSNDTTGRWQRANPLAGVIDKKFEDIRVSDLDYDGNDRNQNADTIHLTSSTGLHFSINRNRLRLSRMLDSKKLGLTVRLSRSLGL